MAASRSTHPTSSEKCQRPVILSDGKGNKSKGDSESNTLPMFIAGHAKGEKSTLSL